MDLRSTQVGGMLESAGQANPKWSLLLCQCGQRTRGAIRNLGRGIPGTRAVLFSGPAHSLARKEAKFDQATAANSSPVLLDSRPAASKRLQTAGTESLETIILSHRGGPIYHRSEQSKNAETEEHR